MRIKEEIKKFGDFWLPSVPQRKVSGTLSISNERGIELEIFQPLESDLKNPFNLVGFNRVIGDVEEYGYVTLEGCLYPPNQRNINQGVLKTRSILWIDRVFTGFAYLENEIPSFNTFKFSIEGIDEWVSADSIELNYDPEGHTAVISYQPSGRISFHLTNDMELAIKSEVKYGSSLNPRQMRVTQKTYFELVSKDIQGLDVFIPIAQKIRDMLCLTINEPVSFDSMSASSDVICQDIGDGNTQPIPINIYDNVYNPSGFYAKDRPNFYQDDMSFGFSDIYNNAEGMINKWIKSYKQYEEAFALYFLAQLRPQPSWRTKFLSLAQGLEVYHRKAFGSENDRLTLKDRLEKLTDPFGNFMGGENRKLLVNCIADTRNYLTHYSSRLETRVAKGTDLHILCLKMELLFELHFLTLMDFSREKIDSIVTYCRKLQLKRSLSLSSGDQENVDS